MTDIHTKEANMIAYDIVTLSAQLPVINHPLVNVAAVTMQVIETIHRSLVTDTEREAYRKVLVHSITEMLS